MNRTLPLKIVGVGRYLPKRIVTNDEIEKMAGLDPGSIDRSSAGVKERRWVTDESASWMGSQAAQEALRDAGMEIDEIDLILNTSGTQEQAIPDEGPLIQRHLGMGSSGIPCMSVHTTCLSFLSGLNIAANFLATHQYRNILLVSSDIASVGINPKERESFVLFGDCAAAAIVTKPKKGERSCMQGYVFRTFGDGAYYTCIMGGGSNRHPNKPTTQPEDNLFQMDGMRVYLMALRHAPQTLEMLRPGLSKGLGDIKLVIPHQASMMAIKAFDRFGYPKEKVVVTLDRLGNCVGASLPATLYEAVRTKRMERGDKVLLVGTGAGLSIGASIIIY